MSKSNAKVKQQRRMKAHQAAFLIWSTLCAAMANAQTSSVGPIVAAVQNHQFDEALTLSDAALKQAPQDIRLWALRGMAYSGKNESAPALQSFEHALTLDPAYLPAL